MNITKKICAVKEDMGFSYSYLAHIYLLSILFSTGRQTKLPNRYTRISTVESIHMYIYAGARGVELPGFFVLFRPTAEALLFVTAVAFINM